MSLKELPEETDDISQESSDMMKKIEENSLAENMRMIFGYLPTFEMPGQRDASTIINISKRKPVVKQNPLCAEKLVEEETKSEETSGGEKAKVEKPEVEKPRKKYKRLYIFACVLSFLIFVCLAGVASDMSPNYSSPFVRTFCKWIIFIMIGHCAFLKETFKDFEAAKSLRRITKRKKNYLSIKVIFHCLAFLDFFVVLSCICYNEVIDDLPLTLCFWGLVISYGLVCLMPVLLVTIMPKYFEAIIIEKKPKQEKKIISEVKKDKKPEGKPSGTVAPVNDGLLFSREEIGVVEKPKKYWIPEEDDIELLGQIVPKQNEDSATTKKVNIPLWRRKWFMIAAGVVGVVAVSSLIIAAAFSDKDKMRLQKNTEGKYITYLEIDVEYNKTIMIVHSNKDCSHISKNSHVVLNEASSVRAYKLICPYCVDEADLVEE